MSGTNESFQADYVREHARANKLENEVKMLRGIISEHIEHGHALAGAQCPHWRKTAFDGDFNAVNRQLAEANRAHAQALDIIQSALDFLEKYGNDWGTYADKMERILNGSTQT